MAFMCSSKEAIIGATTHFCTTSSFLSSFFSFDLKNQYEKCSSEVDKMHLWSEMLSEILEDISDRLPLRDFVAFRGVCKKWRSAPSGRSEIIAFSKETPWFMFYDFDRKPGVLEDTCYLYSLLHPKSCAIRLPHLRGATVMHSNAGWLFACRRHDGHFFLYKPLTLAQIDLPQHIVFKEQVCTMTTPTFLDSGTAFILSRRTDSALEISWCRIGDTEWKNQMAEISKDRIGTVLDACVLRENENTIYIRGSKITLVYDYMNKRCVNEWTAESVVARVRYQERAGGRKLHFWDELTKWYYERAGGGRKLHLLDELTKSPVLRKNWLEKFGEKGILISICPLSMKIDRSYGISGAYRVIPAQSGSKAERKLVRASWIEPRFG